MSPDQGALTLTRECRKCGAEIPWDGGPGRPRVLCDGCRPRTWAPMRGSGINNPVSVDPELVARRTDPQTSHDAARRASVTADNNRGLALLALADHPAGLHDFELAAVTGKAQTSIGVRRKELVSLGLVERAPVGRRPNEHGIVWRITEAGRARAQELRA